MQFKKLALLSIVASLAACGGSDESELSSKLRYTIAVEAGQSLASLEMPDTGDLAGIPQDPNNPITAEKVALGQQLYHETSVSTDSTTGNSGTYSCATCHHVDAGFKSGVPQGLSDGASGFGNLGEGRVATGTQAEIDAVDKQDLTSPAVLNVAYQDVMLWNGGLGKSASSVNSDVVDIDAFGPPPVLANTFGLSGVETQVLAGTKVHRLNFDNVNTDPAYQALYTAAFPNSGDEGTIPSNATVVTLPALGAAKAIAAYERTILANESPFQRWLKGDDKAMTDSQLRGATLFFDKAGCVGCHTGPALSSVAGASEDEIFFSVGFSDFDLTSSQVHGTLNPDNQLGRGGLTKVETDNHKFKVPQLYNLLDTDVLGHGASFKTVRDVIEYKNAGVAQNAAATNLAPEFKPLGLTVSEIDDLTSFVEAGLYDENLKRYVPESVASGNCFPVNDAQSQIDLGC